MIRSMILQPKLTYNEGEISPHEGLTVVRCKLPSDMTSNRFRMNKFAIGAGVYGSHKKSATSKYKVTATSESVPLI